MPKVKAAKPAMTPRKRARARGSASLFSTVRARFERFGAAGVAGAAVLAGALLLVLWAGGYVGLAAQSASRAVGDALVSSGFEVRQVTLRGAHQIPLDDIQTEVASLVGRSILHVSPAEVRARIEALGWVRVASVSRLLPDTVHISVREREPSAVWQIEGVLKLIDSEGAEIRTVNLHEYSTLPFIVDEGAPEAAAEILGALDRHPDLRRRVYALVRVGGRRWNMNLRSKGEIWMPEEGLDDAIRTVSLLNAAHGLLDQPIEYVDLRDPERITICMSDEACALR